MAQYCTDVVVNTPWFKDGFSYQTGVGGASIASTQYLAEIMRERNIHMGFGVGGLTKAMCQLLDDGMARVMLDVQDFDLDAVHNLKNINHHRIPAGVYANPLNKGAVVNKLDYVVLASLEVDVHFNCNVVVGSDGMITGAQGGHPDTAQGAKCAIVICPLLQGRIPAICSEVTTVTTPGESIDVVVTDYGVAVNPARQDILEALKKLQVKKLDLVILTHFDKDHIGGFPELAAALPVDRVILPDYVRSSDLYDAMTASIEEHGIPAERLTAESSFALGRASFTVWPSTKTYDPEKGNDNQMSLVTRVAFGQVRLLFLADAEGGWLKDLCYSTYELGCDVIKIPCHGKWQKHLPALLTLSLPQYAIITDSDKNPAAVETLDALSTMDVTTLRTADGDVHLFTDGQTVTIPKD